MIPSRVLEKEEFNKIDWITDKYKGIADLHGLESLLPMDADFPSPAFVNLQHLHIRAIANSHRMAMAFVVELEKKDYEQILKLMEGNLIPTENATEEYTVFREALLQLHLHKKSLALVGGDAVGWSDLVDITEEDILSVDWIDDGKPNLHRKEKGENQ